MYQAILEATLGRPREGKEGEKKRKKREGVKGKFGHAALFVQLPCMSERAFTGHQMCRFPFPVGTCSCTEGAVREKYLHPDHARLTRM